MGQIKIYQQGRLANLAVGTPGVDQSGAMVANAALQTNESQLQNQNALNSASMQSTNAMRGTALDTNNVINRAQLEGRQTSIENQQALAQSQVEFGNRAQNIQGQDMASALGAFGQNVGYDAQVMAHNKRQAEERVRLATLAQQKMQNDLDVAAFLPQAGVKMKQYAAQLNDGVVNGTIDGNTVSDTYNNGISDIQKQIMDSVPGRYTDYAKAEILKNLYRYQGQAAEDLGTFGHKQANQNVVNTTTQRAADIAGKAGIEPWIDNAGNTYSALSNQALTARWSGINNLEPQLKAVAGEQAAQKIIQDSKQAAFLNWAEQNISHGNTKAVEEYLTPDKDSGRMPVDAFAHIDEKAVAKVQDDIVTETNKQIAIQHREDTASDTMNTNITMRLKANAEAHYDNMPMQASIINQAKAEIAKLQQPSKPGEPVGQTLLRNRNLAKYVDVLNTAVSNVKSYDAEQRRVASENRQMANMNRIEQNRITAQATRDKAAEAVRIQEERKANYNSAAASITRSDISSRLSKMGENDKILNGTAADFASVQALTKEVQDAKNAGYYTTGKPGAENIDKAFDNANALLIARTRRLNQASQSFFGLGGDAPTASATEKLLQEMQAGAHPAIKSMATTPEAKAKLDNGANSELTSYVDGLKKRGISDEKIQELLPQARHRITIKQLTDMVY